MNPGQPFSAPPAPRNLNRGAFYPKRLEYQDVRQQPILLTVAYCRSLQHWVEKHDPPISAKACPLVKSMRELIQAINKVMHITARDVLEGLDLDQPRKAVQPPFATIFGRVLSLPASEPETTLFTEESHQHNVVLRPQGRAHPFPQLGPTQFPIHLPRAPTLPTFPSVRAVTQPPMLPQGLMAMASHLDMPDPPELELEPFVDVAVIWANTPRVSHVNATRVVRDESTGSVYLDTITASIGRVVISGPNGPATSSIIEEVLCGRRHATQ